MGLSASVHVGINTRVFVYCLLLFQRCSSVGENGGVGEH